MNRLKQLLIVFVVSLIYMLTACANKAEQNFSETGRGKVTIEFTITKEGRVRDPLIIQSYPEKVFDKALLKSVSRWKFKPRIVNGQAVARRARQDITFELEK